jgi:uncharacterized membrane protein YfcA
MPRFLVAALVGVFAGLSSGLFGIGGGLVFVPGLVLLLGFPQHRAHATSSVAVIGTAAVGAVRFFSGGAADVRAGSLLAAGAILGALIGATLMGRVPSTKLKALFAVVALVAAVRLALGASDGGGTLTRLDVDAATVAAIVLLGAATGTLVSMLGLGGGLVYVPTLTLIFGLEQHISQGTSLVAIVPTQVAAAIVHHRAYRVDLAVAAVMGGGGMVGALIGAHVAFSLSAGALKVLFSALLILAAILQVLKREDVDR